jgi:signal transduction histidine kinase
LSATEKVTVFHSVRIQTKLAATLAIPLVALVGLSVFVVSLSARDADAAEERADRAREEVALATAALGPNGVLNAIQTERNAIGVTMLGMDPSVNVSSVPDGQNVPLALRGMTDEAVRAFRASVASRPQPVRDIYQPAIDVLDELPAIRTDIDNDPNPYGLTNPAVERVHQRYNEVVDTIFDANTNLSLAIDDPAMRTGATLIDVTARDREYGTALTTETLKAFLPTAPVTQALVVMEVGTRVKDADEELRNTASGPYEAIIADGLADPRLAGYRTLVDDVIGGRERNILEIIGPRATATWESWQELDRELGAQLNADAAAVQAQAEQDAGDARDRQRNVTGLAAGVVAIAVAGTVLASRSISQPLLRLAGDAEQMAAERLPGAVKEILDTPLGEDVVVPQLSPVPAGGGAEINEVAGALNTVQTSAAYLAVEQALLRRNIADSFVNLGRRNQNLLSRQIDSITQMEHEASDPDSLERLFALDHLATRMRRNAESLLLLGGLEPHRQWSAPVPLLDVIRGALGEVEDYRRVGIHDFDEVFVRGVTVADLTHLLAELIENALNFSPPDRLVEVIGRESGGDPSSGGSGGGGYALAIVDDGIGMSDEAIEVANRRLSGRESFTVAPSKYLGHYVVGVQAARLGVEVSLHHSPSGGVTALIELGRLIEEPAGAPPAPADDAPAAPEPQAQTDWPAPASTGDMPTAPAPDGGVTASGYRKRVRGANRPSTDILTARRRPGAEDQTPPAGDD